MIKKLLYILSIISLWSACQQTDLKPIAIVYNYNYFPLDSGAWREFEVTRIEIDKASNRFDTSRYYLLEKWAGWVLGAANDSMMRLERYTRTASNQQWNILSVWQAGIINHEAIQAEENIRYLKLDFPVQLNKTWNGDCYNHLDALNQYHYTIETMDEPFSMNGIAFDSVLTVVQKDKSSLIDSIYFEEKYALGVGLIEKQQTDIYSYDDDFDPTIPIEERVTRGTIYSQKIVGYGKK